MAQAKDKLHLRPHPRGLKSAGSSLHGSFTVLQGVIKDYSLTKSYVLGSWEGNTLRH